MPPIEFGINVRAATSQADFHGFVRRVDELGYDVLAVPDHLGVLAPFPAMAAGGMLSSRLRLRTYVLNVGFWNPALLAREVATLDVLSDGRAELGLGAGHMKREYDDARLPWHPPARRIQALEDTLLEVRRRLAADDHAPKPVQHPVPVMIGAMSKAGLAVAARHADIVGFAGLRQVPGQPPGTFTLSSEAEARDRVEEVRRQAGNRRYRSEALLQAVVLGKDPETAAAAIAAGSPALTVDLVLGSPFVLLARDAGSAAAELLRRRADLGFESFTTHQANLEAFGEVIAAVRGDLSA